MHRASIFSCLKHAALHTKTLTSTSTFEVASRQIPAHIPLPPYATPQAQSPPPPPSIPERQSANQVAHIRKASRLVRQLLSTLPASILQQPDINLTTQAIDDWVFARCLLLGVYPSPLGYHGFPKSICTSVNSVACHGIPASSHRLSPGDLISVDITVFNGHAHGDACEAFLIPGGDVRESWNSQLLLDCARQCRDAGVAVCRPGANLGEIGAAIERVATREGFTVVPNIRGHGIGSYFHGPPDISHVIGGGGPDDDVVMQSGWVFTVEPCVTEGNGVVGLWESDGWTVETLDGGRCAQFEHTVHVTDTGVEILTL